MALDALRELIALEDDAGRPVVLRLDAEPHPATRRLMDTLGVGVEVRAVTVVVAQVETRCPHEGCSWTFVGTALRGKAAVPQHLAIAHGGRHPGAPAAGRAALDAMDAGDPQTPEAGPVEPEAEPERAAEVAVKRERPPSKWTRETIVAAIRAFADEHGRTPTQRDAGNAGLVIAGKREFGSWGDAVEAAGFERPRRGHTNRVDAGVAQPERAPADQADDAGSKPAPRSEVPADRQQDAGTEPAAPPEREPTGQEPPDEDASVTSRLPDDRPDSREPTVATAELASRSDAAADEPGGALDLAALTNGDADSWITRCDREAERCTEEAARLVRRAKAFETIGDGLRILRETSA